MWSIWATFLWQIVDLMGSPKMTLLIVVTNSKYHSCTCEMMRPDINVFTSREQAANAIVGYIEDNDFVI